MKLITSKSSAYQTSGLLLLTFSTLANAATIANPSFEDDPERGAPGYGAITDWDSSGNDDRVGINYEGNDAFAGAGPYPDGAKVAFLQTNEDLTTNSLTGTISGLEIGKKYTIGYRTNSRSGYAAPDVFVGTGASTSNVFTQNAGVSYQPRQFTFVATATTQQLRVQSETTGDGALIIDDFRIVEGAWSQNAWINDASLTTSGSITHAYNLGNGATAVTAGSIDFLAVAAANPSATASGAYGGFSTSGFGGSADDTNNILGDGAALSSGFVYGGNPGSLTIDDLEIGQNYILSLLSVGFEDGFRIVDIGTGTESLVVDQDFYGDNNGIKTDIAYTATDTSMTFDFTPEDAGSTFHLYGFYNAVPEPTSALLLCLVGLGFLRRHRN